MQVAPRLIALLVGIVVLACFEARAFAASEKTTFAIVHGATAGAWEWKSTGKFLSDDGHIMYRVTLTGLGEREHLNSPEIDLQTQTSPALGRPSNYSLSSHARTPGAAGDEIHRCGTRDVSCFSGGGAGRSVGADRPVDRVQRGSRTNPADGMEQLERFRD